MKTALTLTFTCLLVAFFRFNFKSQINVEQQEEAFWINKTFQSSNNQLLVAGDSRIYRGVSANVIIKTSGLNVKGYNLGYSSAGFSKQYLDFVISKFALSSKQKILLLGVTPHSLTAEAFRNDHFNQFYNLGRIEVFKKKYINKVLPYVTPVKPSQLLIKKNSYHQVYHRDGWIASNKLGVTHYNGYNSYKKTFSTYKVTSEEVSVFLNQVKEIKKQGIAVFAFRPPSSKIVRDLEDQISGFDEHYVKKSLKKMGVFWFDFNDKDYYSYDGSHLEEQSALKFSAELGKIIAKQYVN